MLALAVVHDILDDDKLLVLFIESHAQNLPEVGS